MHFANSQIVLFGQLTYHTYAQMHLLHITVAFFKEKNTKCPFSYFEVPPPQRLLFADLGDHFSRFPVDKFIKLVKQLEQLTFEQIS